MSGVAQWWGQLRLSFFQSLNGPGHIDNQRWLDRRMRDSGVFLL